MTELPDSRRAFIESHPSAAMITVDQKGTPHAVRIGLYVFEGKLWSSATKDRVRTKRLRRDPRCTLFVFDPGWMWLTLETTVRILDGPDAPELNLKLFRKVQQRPTGELSWFGKQLGEAEFLRVMAEEKRLIYEFDVISDYGMA